MLEGHLPFRGENKKEIIKNICNGAFSFSKEREADLSESCVDLIKSMLNPDWRKRITIAQIQSSE